MPQQSARLLLGLPVIEETTPNNHGDRVGIVETITINPNLMTVDGFLIGRAGQNESQAFIPLGCVTEYNDYHIQIHAKIVEKPTESRRIFSLPAWTIHPKVLVGFVHDFTFSRQTGLIDTFVIHQLFRTWTIPSRAVEKITPHALLIANDTTIKLKISPMPAEPI
jgi:uncharacterized protein YrrD